MIWMLEEIRDLIVAEGHRTFPLETGGLLCGYRCENGDQVVTKMIGPGPKANHQRFEFEPDYKWHSEEFQRLWDLDNTLWYLGDWHTHPHGPAEPSSVDFAMATKTAGNPEACCPNHIMIIVGSEVEKFAAWVFIDGTQVEVPIKLFQSLPNK